MDIESLFTPEEENLPITYGELFKVLTALTDVLSSGHQTDQEEAIDGIFSVIDNAISVIEDAEYKRMRDVRFFLGLISQIHCYDKDILRKEYERWCDAFDKLNKPQSDSEGANE